MGVVSCALQYYNMFYRMYAWAKSFEPMTSKFQRWILGVPNVKPLCIKETEYNSQVQFTSDGNFKLH